MTDSISRYLAAEHAMQSGVAMEMQQGSGDTEPKHLRVGVNSAMCEHAGLARLLISKGVITEEEYTEAIAAEMEAEVGRYEQRISERLGTNVTLR